MALFWGKQTEELTPAALVVPHLDLMPISFFLLILSFVHLRPLLRS